MKENIYRTHNCNEISLEDVGKQVVQGPTPTCHKLIFLNSK